MLKLTSGDVARGATYIVVLQYRPGDGELDESHLDCKIGSQ